MITREALHKRLRRLLNTDDSGTVLTLLVYRMQSHACLPVSIPPFRRILFFLQIPASQRLELVSLAALLTITLGYL